jgi:hypothetical protein
VWFVVVVLGVVAFITLYAIWTARRLDRLHARVDAAAAALQAQLIRRCATATDFSTAVPLPVDVARALADAAHAAAYQPGLGHDREVAETVLTRALAQAITRAPGSFLVPSEAATAMHDEALRASFARRFYNDTVRDALVVRDRRVVRWLRLAGRAPHPAYFEMDDEELPVSQISVATGRILEA